MNSKGKMASETKARDRPGLKQCPFCGGEMEPEVMCFQHPHDQSYYDWMKEKGILPPIMTGFHSGFVVRCYHCGAQTAERSSKELAAKEWNRRQEEKHEF